MTDQPPSESAAASVKRAKELLERYRKFVRAGDFAVTCDPADIQELCLDVQTVIAERDAARADKIAAIDISQECLRERDKRVQERDAARAEVERLTDLLEVARESRDDATDTAVGKVQGAIAGLRADLQSASRTIKSMGETCDQQAAEIERLKACVDAQSATCGRYAAQLAEAVALLRQCKDGIVSSYYLDELYVVIDSLLATIDAEARPQQKEPVE